jgi:hypothetical protein
MNIRYNKGKKSNIGLVKTAIAKVICDCIRYFSLFVSENLKNKKKQKIKKQKNRASGATTLTFIK